jgi:signal transduction histidine kinase
LAFSLGLLLAVILKQQRHAKLLSKKRQLSVVAWGIIFYALSAITSNVILPAIQNDWSSSRYGPAFTLLFVAVVGYAIIRHRMFDIRFIVARTVGYVTAVASLALIYGFVVFGTANLLFDLRVDVRLLILLSLATGIAGLFFQKFQKSFNKFTNQIFYRDAYDSEVFIDKFNNNLVTTYDFEQLLKNSSRIIEEDLKPTNVVFAISENKHARYRVIGTKVDAADAAELHSALSKSNEIIITTDFLNEREAELQKKLSEAGLAVITRIASTKGESVGFMALGPKKSGNLYSSQDVRIIEIISKELAIAIQNALRIEEIENFNLTLQAKVNVATRQLRQTNDRLKLMDETKDDFISMASHQLRTPLTSMKGYISMVLDGDAGRINKQQRQMLEQAFISSQRMVYLIADLLNLSRLKTGKFIVDAAPTNLAELVHQEVAQLIETAKSRGIKLHYEEPKDFPTLMLDETKTRQVVMNFVDNAIYYTPSGGDISIALKETPKSVELRVVDTGIGVPKVLQPHLFTKFYRAPNAKKARPDGTGLGLFMARKAIVAQGGAIIFNSEEGKGSTFGFSFPKAKLAVPEPVPKK